MVEGEYGIEDPDGEDKTQSSAAEAQDEAFYEHLPCKTGTTGPQSHSYRYFFNPGACTRQQEIRYVGAGNQQDQTDNAQEEIKSIFYRFALTDQRGACRDQSETFGSKAGLALGLNAWECL